MASQPELHVVTGAFVPTCPTRFREWANENAALLGREYASELERHYR